MLVQVYAGAQSVGGVQTTAAALLLAGALGSRGPHSAPAVLRAAGGDWAGLGAACAAPPEVLHAFCQSLNPLFCLELRAWLYKALLCCSFL